MSTTNPPGLSLRDSSGNDQQCRGMLAGTDGHDGVNVDQLADGLAGKQPALSLHEPSVLFSGGDGAGGAGTIVLEDNANFVYDRVNHRLILRKGGTYAPAAGAPLTISGSASGVAVLLDQAA